MLNLISTNSRGIVIEYPLSPHCKCDRRHRGIIECQRNSPPNLSLIVTMMIRLPSKRRRAACLWRREFTVNTKYVVWVAVNTLFNVQTTLFGVAIKSLSSRHDPHVPFSQTTHNPPSPHIFYPFKLRTFLARPPHYEGWPIQRGTRRAREAQLVSQGLFKDYSRTYYQVMTCVIFKDALFNLYVE